MTTTRRRSVNVSLELDGDALQAIDGATRRPWKSPQSREARVDWRVKAMHEGEAKFRMRADAGDDGDAVERTLPVLVHGMLRQDAWSRTVEPGTDSAKIAIEVPEQRRPDQSKLTVRFSPTDRRCGRRCDSISRELSLRLHRANA